MAEKKNEEYQIKITKGSDEVISLKLLPEPLKEFWGWLCKAITKKEKKND